MEEQTIFSEMWNAYRGVILHSIVTSFGLDFIVKDQNGGDVDTIYNVYKTGTYKNSKNAEAYEARGDYDPIAYHHNEAYDAKIRDVKNNHAFFEDAYVPGNRIFYGKASDLKSDRKANLDHVISAHEIHNDRRRVLAGLDGVELANSATNLQFTNEQLNKSMGDMTVEEYIKWRIQRGNPLPGTVAEEMRKKDSAARKEYERSIAEAYYSGGRFIHDVRAAATKRGLEMGIRQVLGFVFVEVWCSCEDEIKKLPSGISFSDCMHAVSVGIQKGFHNAKERYKDILSQFAQGFTAGAIASLTTALINIFVSTDKNAVRYIRQIYTIVVQVGNILLVNPDDLLLGDQLKSAMVALSTGSGVLAGTAVSNQIAETPIGKDKTVGLFLQNFCASLVSGLLSCSLLIMIDRSRFINELVTNLNVFATVDHSILETSRAFIKIAAEVAQFDIDTFTDEVEKFDVYSKQLINAEDDEIHDILFDLFREFDISVPWQGEFNEFMGDESNSLIFE